MSTDGHSHSLTAIDIAVLPPSDLSHRAVALSAALPANQFQGLRLDADHPPHITLTQQFVPADSLDALLGHVDRVLSGHEPLHLRVTGGGKGTNSVWMAIERTPALVALHERLQHATEPFEIGTGDAAAFVDGDARDGDVRWVQRFRRESSFASFTPHITVGHASEPPFVEPMEVIATTIAVCQLGRFCTCRRIIRAWELTPR